MSPIQFGAVLAFALVLLVIFSYLHTSTTISTCVFLLPAGATRLAQPQNKTFQSRGTTAVASEEIREQFRKQDGPEDSRCKAWEESISAAGIVEIKLPSGARDFNEEPIRIYETKQLYYPQYQYCDVGCRTTTPSEASVDDGTPWDAVAHFDSQPNKINLTLAPTFVLRNIESPSNFGLQLSVDRARSDGYDVTVAFELDADVPVVYTNFDGAGDFLARPLEVEEKVPGAAAFISNCDMVTSFRMEAMERMRELGVVVDSYGKCGHTKNVTEDDWYGMEHVSKYVTKLGLVRRYMFYCAFENSVFPDYVTEKFYHGLRMGAVPIVVGAPNVGDFAPSPNSFLRIGSLEDIPAVVEKMKEAMRNRTYYESMLAWKSEAPSETFRAITDLPAVHPTCRLCILLADRIRENEWREGRGNGTLHNGSSTDTFEDSTRLPAPYEIPAQSFDHCACSISDGPTPEVLRTKYLLFVRERGLFRFRPVFLGSEDLTLYGLHRAIIEGFMEMSHRVTWQEHRERSSGLAARISSWDRPLVHRVYEVGRTQRQVLFGNGSLQHDAQVEELMKSQPCPRLEVIFV